MLAMFGPNGIEHMPSFVSLKSIVTWDKNKEWVKNFQEYVGNFFKEIFIMLASHKEFNIWANAPGGGRGGGQGHAKVSKAYLKDFVRFHSNFEALSGYLKVVECRICGPSSQ